MWPASWKTAVTCPLILHSAGRTAADCKSGSVRSTSLHRVQRLDGVLSLPAFLAMPFFLEGRVFRLNLGGVAEHQFHQVGRGRGGDDRAAKPLLHQLRRQPAVVDVGVGQQHGVEISRSRMGLGSQLRARYARS